MQSININTALLLTIVLGGLQALAAPVTADTTTTKRTTTVTSECARADKCGRISDAMLTCDRLGTDETELRRCICTRDPTWEKDVLECVLCWNAEPPNYELGIVLKYSQKHLCGGGVVDVCESICNPAWHTIHTCGSAGSDKQACICRYKPAWGSSIDWPPGYSCAECLEGNGETTLATQLRKWIEFPCEATTPGPLSGDGDSSSTGTKNDGATAAAATRRDLLLVWGLQALFVMTA
ncbi:hypothetical protein B0H63DRAFT_517551 [Podospora didyma]|uniref:Uncharacterized protein n=1 Tax=Podospora didyma TaxID=330526 RepID=A0AAE0U875_9PEZI|nr:hypothetical protein B0H63DRAFT_517551 [Podospora didyma]